MKKLPWIITVIWVGIVIVVPFCCARDKLPSHLNEWGDYLAGAFSPLAFFWLIMGYLQQGKELQQNTKALELQAQELQNSVAEQRNSIIEQQNSVKQQEAQVKVLQEQLEKNLEWQEVQMNQREPSFILEALDSHTIKIQNVGGEARYLEEAGHYIHQCAQLRYGEVVQFSINQELYSSFAIKYINYLNQRYYVSFFVTKNEGGIYNFQQTNVKKISDD